MTKAAGACVRSETWIKPSPIRKEEWRLIGVTKMQFLKCGVCRGQTPHFLFSELISQEEEGERADAAGREQDPHVLHEIREGHQSQTAEHHLPKIHALAVDEGDKSDRAKNKTADQIRGIELKHADPGS
jgi:hypothetical protein